ncbi:glutathione S-transferase [Psychrobium sp. 1_MG-2023]|uniref:glutathione S-transferase n=1 Tax=Psychrobium sp. 1_MG-2023 TaxID=3062624 RepID=UPI000C33CCA4|nr:glutathione S-transferase [Psychrobium sp. 1_MG-2023]MDP2562003.1 glutathione S-transferase [Psychrobium sp. 1_MG-2023]PKF58615.1 glutathione S-transferase [Alteromonadales bacterium alter-6D02]
MNTLPILYSFRRCPYAMRARMAIYLNDTTTELREVVLKDKPHSLLEYSPKGTVPVLVLADSQVIEESREIMDWAINNAASPTLALATATQVELIDYNDNDFKQQLDRYKYFDRHPEHTQSEYRKQGEFFLQRLEQMLTEQDFLFGDSYSYADIAIFPFIRQFAHVDKTWFDAAPYPRLQQWLSSFLAMHAFAQVMTKFPQWQPNHEVCHFPATEVA